MNTDLLRERARIVRAIRQFFDERDFVEVETAVRIPAPAPEEHIDCPPVRDGGFLRASPEIQMKKLLAAGMDKIYQIGPCFREGEKGSRHNPEFTMIEWYRRGATYLDIRQDLEELLEGLFEGEEQRSKVDVDADSCPRQNKEENPSGRGKDSASTVTVREAYLTYAGWDPWESWDQDRFDFDMATKIEPAIKAMGGGVFLMDYPPQAASLAKLSSTHYPLPSTLYPLPSTLYPYAERWEFYYDGMELANCFTELCDECEQRQRFEKARQNRRELGESDYPIDDEFLGLLPQIGRASGVALGVDRLIMILTGTQNISAVRADL